MPLRLKHQHLPQHSGDVVRVEIANLLNYSCRTGVVASGIHLKTELSQQLQALATVLSRISSQLCLLRGRDLSPLRPIQPGQTQMGVRNLRVQVPGLFERSDRLLNLPTLQGPLP